MSSRAKCPACGRKQHLHEGDAGQIIFCSACGNRFVAVVVDAADTTPAVPPPPQEITPLVLDPVPMVFSEESLSQWNYVPPPPIAPPPTVKWLLPVAIAMVLTTGATIVLGIYLLTSWLNNYPQQAAKPPEPATLPTVVLSKPAPQLVEVTPGKDLVAPVTPPPPVIETAPIVRAKPKPVPIVPPGFHPVRPASASPDLDDQIGRSINNGVNFLLSQFVNGKLKDYSKTEPQTAGMDALAVYALLHAAEATHDLRLIPSATLVNQMLDALKAMPMEHDFSTYGRALRAAALGVYHRAEDKQAMRADATWLINDSVNGAFYYWPPDAALKRTLRSGPARLGLSAPWDNSNSQYGALGVWAAMDAGTDIPYSFWTAVQHHWLSCQLPDGEWAYGGYGDMGELSMTVAGITTLLVAEDQLGAKSVANTLGHPPFTAALAHALTWLEADNNSVSLPEHWHSYNLFGLERAALASGFKYFGRHDWYRELAPQQLSNQAADGSWAEEQSIMDTSYTLLFLSRGRHPIFMNKLRFDGYWSNRPRDISNLTHDADTVLERPMNWQVVSLKSDWTDWMDSPVLYIASHESLKFTDADCDKLRGFTENGGLIFTHADGDYAAFNKSVVELSHRLFPQYTLADLPATHPIYSSLYQIKPPIRLQGISNGSRLLLVNSPTDLNRAWQQNDLTGRPSAFQMGINIFIYAAGKTDLRNKLKTPVVPEPQVNPIRTTTVAQLRHLGDWNPEPAGLPRFARLFLGRTSVKVNVVDADPAELDAGKMILTHLTGTAAIHLKPDELKAIHDYVDKGGILLIDACGASSDFNKSMLIDFLPHAFPKSLFSDMRNDNPLLAGTGEGMLPVNPRLRPYRTETDGSLTQPIQYFSEGKGTVIFSPVDLSTALLGTSTWAINGYTPDTAYNLLHNVLLSVLGKN